MTLVYLLLMLTALVWTVCIIAVLFMIAVDALGASRVKPSVPLARVLRHARRDRR